MLLKETCKKSGLYGIQNKKIGLRTMVQQKESKRSILDARNAEMRQCEYGGHFS